MIYFRTCAYNAEKTIRRTIESVLSQTVGDFKYYILENGSTDGTRKIIQEYAEKDHRIVAFYNKVNRRVEENPDFWNISYRMEDDDCLAILDADDYYEPTFAEEIINFMMENILDVAACGTIIEDENGNELSRTTQINNLLLRTKKEYDESFAAAHWNMRQVWGKIYRGSVAKHRYETDLPDWFPTAYGGDTINVMHSLRFSQGFGILAKGLHHYQLSRKSVSYRWIEGRENSDITLDRFAKQFLIEKAGRISQYNRQFLAAVYINALKDTFNVLLQADISSSKVMEVTAKIFCNEATREILDSKENLEGLKEQVFVYRRVLTDWMISNYKGFTKEMKKDAYLFLCSYGPHIEKLLSEQATEALMLTKPSIIKAILNAQFGTLLSEVIEYINLKRNKKILTVEDAVFAQNVAAYLGGEELYTIFSKLYIEALIEEKKIGEAKRELDEWLAILPTDEEFIEMKKRLEKYGE